MPAHPRPWTAREDAELRRLFAAGADYDEIGRSLARGPHSVRGHARRLGLRFYRWPTAGEKARALALVAAGESDAATARALGVAQTTARRYRIESGLPARNGSEAAWETRRAAANPLAPTGAEVRILALLAGGPATVGELADRYGRTRAGVKTRLVRMRKKGLAFAEGRPSGPPGVRWQSLSWWFLHNRGLVYLAADRVRRRNPHADREDVASEIRCAVARCVAPFRARGVKFASYAMKAAHFEALGYCLDERRRGVRVPTQLRFDAATRLDVGSLESFAAGDDAELDRLDCLADRRGDGAPPMGPDFWQRAVAGLEPRVARVILAHYRDGRMQVDIGVELGVSRARVEQLVRKGEEAIRERGLLDEYDPRECA